MRMSHGFALLLSHSLTRLNTRSLTRGSAVEKPVESSAGRALLEEGSHWGYILGGLLAFLPVYTLLVRPQSDVSSHTTPPLWSHPGHKGLYIPSQTMCQNKLRLSSVTMSTALSQQEKCLAHSAGGQEGRDLWVGLSPANLCDRAAERTLTLAASISQQFLPHFKPWGRHKAAEGRNAHTSSREGRERKGSMAQLALSNHIITCGWKIWKPAKEHLCCVTDYTLTVFTTSGENIPCLKIHQTLIYKLTTQVVLLTSFLFCDPDLDNRYCIIFPRLELLCSATFIHNFH